MSQIKEIRKKKPLVCKNCKLYDAKARICTVVILDKGQKLELMTEPNDPCMWERMGVEVQRIRAWSDGENGFIEWTEKPEEIT